MISTNLIADPPVEVGQVWGLTPGRRRHGRTEPSLPGGWSSEGDRVELDIGDVLVIARVPAVDHLTAHRAVGGVNYNVGPQPGYPHPHHQPPEHLN